MAHLAATAANDSFTEIIDVNLEDVLIDPYYWFDKSSKRKGKLAEYFEFCDQEYQQVLKHVTCRWLSLEHCIERALKKFPSLKSYFRQNKREKGDLKKQMQNGENGSFNVESRKKMGKNKNPSKSRSELISAFHKLVAEGPTYVCVCCDQLWYEHGVEKAAKLSGLTNVAVKKCMSSISNDDINLSWICKTCIRNLKKGKIPRCSKVNKMSFPLKPEELDLSELESRLFSPRLVFEKLYKAPRGKQMKIIGNVVNVPANVVNTVHVLPRLSNESGIIKVQLKRKLKYKSYMLSENIRPDKEFKAAKWLTENGRLFQKEKIVLNEQWSDYGFTLGSVSELSTSKSNGDLSEIPSTSREMSSSSVSKSKSMLYDGVSLYGKMYFCLECGCCIQLFSDLNDHMIEIHNASYSYNYCCSNRYTILQQNESEDNHVFVCSICNFVDFEKNVLTEHMTLIHDIPSEELTQKCCLLTKDVNVAIHRILEGQTVLLAQVYKSGFFFSIIYQFKSFCSSS